MNIAQYFNNEYKTMAMKLRYSAQKGRITKLDNEVRKLQYLVKENILSWTERANAYKGNSYPTYEAAVNEIAKKYNATADWGVLQTGNIIDLRSAVIINEGPQIQEKSPDVNADKEIEWVNNFLEFNDIDKEIAQQFAKEAEIEGKLALQLKVSKDKKNITCRYLSWSQKGYNITPDPQDYLDYQRLTWKASGTMKAGNLTAEQFVYKKFGGRIDKPNEAAPKIMKCLTQLENLDKALTDWRKINYIFGGPILYWEIDGDVDDAAGLVDNALEALDNKNFKINKTIAGIGDLHYVKLDTGGIDSIEREIIILAKMIAGTTGVSVQYLGLADLLKNRSTSDDMRQMLTTVTTPERQTWKGAYEELIKKAMVMWNSMSGKTQLDPNKIKIDIPVITQQQWEHLEKVFLPACLAGKLSDETLWEQTPGVDVKVELKRREEREKTELEEVKKENEDLKTDRMDKELFGKNNKGEEE